MRGRTVRDSSPSPYLLRTLTSVRPGVVPAAPDAPLEYAGCHGHIGGRTCAAVEADLHDRGIRLAARYRVYAAKEDLVVPAQVGPVDRDAEQVLAGAARDSRRAWRVGTVVSGPVDDVDSSRGVLVDGIQLIRSDDAGGDLRRADDIGGDLRRVDRVRRDLRELTPSVWISDVPTELGRGRMRSGYLGPPWSC